MENARIVHFEDDESFRKLCEIYVDKMFGHQVLYSIASMDQAREFIEGLETGQVDVAIIDGNLNSRTISGNDGAEIVELLHAKDPRVTTIGFSGGGDVPGANLQVGKGNFDKLKEAIKEL